MSAQLNEKNIANELVEKAIQIFSIKGYESTNLADITDALGVSRGPVYYHFKDKYGLYKATYDCFEKETREAHSKMFAEEKHIIKYFENIIYNCIEQFNRFGANFLLGVDNLPELSDIKKQYDLLAQDIYQQKINLVKKSMSKGEIRQSIDPKIIVDLIYVTYLGITNGLNFPLIIDYKEGEINYLVTILLLGIERYCCD